MGEILKLPAPPPKNETQRAFICASLASGASRVQNYSKCEDTLVLIDSLRCFGVGIEEKENEVIIKGNGGKVFYHKPVALDVKGSRASLNDMTTYSSLCKEHKEPYVIINGDLSLGRRSIKELLDALGQLGVKTSSSNGKPPIVIEGGYLKGGYAKIDLSESSQAASAIALCAPCTDEGVELEIIDEIFVSKPYFEITKKFMNHFGAELTYDNKSIKIAKQNYKSCDIIIGGDFSAAAFRFAEAAVNQKTIRITNLYYEKTAQGDKKFLDWLLEMGCDVYIGDDYVEVWGQELQGITVDATDYPDLVPPLIAVASAAEGITTINNISRLKKKESNRVSSPIYEFGKLGIKITERENSLEVEGTGGKYDKLKLRTARCESDDHRVIMGWAVLVPREEQFDFPKKVNKSDPTWWDDRKKIEQFRKETVKK